MQRLHPGEVLLETYMKPSNIGINELARKINVSPATISRLVNKKSDLSVDMAIKLSEVFKRSAKGWLNLQIEYDLSLK